jgi:hypothetical protein
MGMEKKAWALLLLVLVPGILGPLARIWEQAQPERHVCPPCLKTAPFRPMGGGTCGSPPRVNALCPRCGKYWHSSAAPETSWAERTVERAVPIRVPTVFSDPWVGAYGINPDLLAVPPR